MTDQSLIIAVAKLDGHFNGTKIILSGDGIRFLSDYLNCRDAIIPVIEKVCISNQEIKVKFLNVLRNLAEEYFDRKVSDFDCLIMPTKYFSIALLKATGKWEE